MSSQVTDRWHASWRRIGWILIAALAVDACVTRELLMASLSVSDPLVAQIRIGLEWRAQRGAQELAGLAVSDKDLFNKAIDAYAASPDILSIAIETGDQIITSHGTSESFASVLDAEAGTLVRGEGYVGSWAEPAVDGTPIDKVAVMVSTQPLAEAEAMQAHVSRLIVGAGVAAGILGAIAVAVAVLVWRAIRRRKPDDRDAEADEPAVPGPDADADADAGGGVDVELADRMQELEDSNRSMRLVLDNTAQGFLAVDLVGRVTSERSAVIHRWFGEPVVGTMLGDYLSAHSREFALQFSGALDSLCAGMLPLQDCLDQMPKRLTTDANAFDVRYAPLLRDDRPERILLIIDDVSEQVVRERAEQEQREQRELAALSQLIVDGRAEFDEFFAEAAGLVSSLDTPGEPEVERGTLRKLKESCAYYGLETYVELCTRIEATVADLAGPISDQDRVALSQVWGRIASRLASRMA